MRKYYHAYDERYNQVHQQGLLWFSNRPTPEVGQWLNHYQVAPGSKLWDIGCGEGRDALHLAKRGYQLTAFDVSPEAIRICREQGQREDLEIDWRVADATDLGSLETVNPWVYSIGTLHMLTEDNDRHLFLTSLYNLLSPGGKLLLVNMGDGFTESITDPERAFLTEERLHSPSGRTLRIAATTCRKQTWTKHRKELTRAGFIIERTMVTVNQDYQQCMTVYLSKGA